MGSMIHLAIGNFEIDWGKNNFFTMHGALFQSGDITQVPYRYAAGDDQTRVEMQEGMARPLSDIVHRLELMGYTLAAARREFDALLLRSSLDAPPITFDVLAQTLRMLDVEAASADYETDYDFGKFFAREIFDRLKLGAVTGDESSVRYDLGEIMENLNPYIILRLLAENPSNLTKQVSWHYADVVDGGWTSRDDIIGSIGAESKFLVVTEGSSDARVLGHALALLRPDIADFFYFVDMEEGYPFTGTGNLHRFCQGLVSIRIENRVVIIYDNDAEGSAKFAETAQLRLPSNMRVMQLPSHASFTNFATAGPSGHAAADINGCAAAIECYLDLAWEATKAPIVRWTNFTPIGRYQGALVDKEAYARRFLKLRRCEPGYDFSKLNVVLDDLIHQCTGIAER